MENPSHHNFPQDLITEILLRLPVKSLLRFKCVSRVWNALIVSSTFANQHFSHESNQERLLLSYYKPDEKKYAFTLYVDDMLSQYEEPDYEILDMLDHIMGPLNGVFCVFNTFGKIAFFNFAMRQMRLLPDLVHSSYINQSRLSFISQVFGFGLDPSSGDHKLVSIQIFRDKENNTSYHPCIIFVYSSDSDSWKHFEEADVVNSKCTIYEPMINTYVNEVYYWLMELDDDNRTCCILAFNMRHDKFRQIEALYDIDIMNAELGLYGDSLALLIYGLNEYIDVWIMKRGEYWIKSFTVGPIQDLSWPLGFWKKNMLCLLEPISLQALSMYDGGFKILRNFEDGTINECLLMVFVYKESLISVKRKGEQMLFTGCFLS